MKMFTVWIWADTRNEKLEDRVRQVLRNHGFEWDVKIGDQVMSAPITVECSNFEFGIDESHTVEDFDKWLNDFSVSENGKLLYRGATMDELDKRIFGTVHCAPRSDEAAEEAAIEELNDPYDK